MAMCNECHVLEPSPSRPRRRWTTADKIRIVAQTFEPGVSIGRVARRNGIDHHLLRRWRRLLSRNAFGEAGVDRRCAFCNEPFEAARLDAKFCSSKCRQRAYRRHKSPRPEGS
jgi:transposase-like protein